MKYSTAIGKIHKKVNIMRLTNRYARKFMKKNGRPHNTLSKALSSQRKHKKIKYIEEELDYELMNYYRGDQIYDGTDAR